MMFEDIGKIVHLVQDKSVPAHVRNDAHIPYVNPLIQQKDMYENYTKDALAGKNGYPSLTFSGYPAVDLTTFNIFDNFWDTNTGLGLAEFTNRNFISRDTNFNDLKYKNYNMPVATGSWWTTEQVPSRFFEIGTEEIKVRYSKGYVTDYYKGETSKTIERLAAYSYFDYEMKLHHIDREVFSLNKLVHKEYADFLIPRSVGYSAGLLNYFFRGEMEAKGVEKVDSSGTSGIDVTIKNTTPNEEMSNGTFFISYRYKSPGSAEYTYGLSSGTSSGTLPFNADMPEYSFSFTQSIPNDATEKQYVLVFHGTLGKENNAVVGKVVDLSSVWEDWNIGDYTQQKSETYYRFEGTFKVTDTQFNLKTDKRTWEGWWNTWASPDPAIRINDGFLKMDADTGNYSPDSQHGPMLQGLLYKSLIESPFSITGCKIKIKTPTAKFGYLHSDNSLKAFLLITNGSNYYVLVYSLVDGDIERSLEDDFRNGLAIENSYSDENIKSYISDINNWYITLIALFYQVEGANNHLSLSMDYIDFDCN